MTLKDGDVDLQTLTKFQHLAEQGVFRRTMYAYTEWLKDFLTDENINRFVKLLKSSFEVYRDEFRNNSVDCHGRIPEIVSCLKIGMKLFLMFLTDYQVVKKEYAEAIENHYEIMLNEIASHQSDNIESERPTSVFVKKIYSLIVYALLYLGNNE